MIDTRRRRSSPAETDAHSRSCRARRHFSLPTRPTTVSRASVAPLSTGPSITPLPQLSPVSIQMHATTHATHRKVLRKKKVRKRNKKCTRNAINARKLRKQKKQKYASASHATDASGQCVRKRNDRTDSIFHATNTSASQ